MRVILWVLAVLALTQFHVVPGARAASPALNFRADGSTVIATGPGGRDLWRRRMASALLPLMLEPQPDGGVLVNGQTYIRSDGRLRDEADAATPAATSYVWDLPGVVKDVVSVAFVPQLVDKNGNIWTVLDDGEGNSARVMQYVVKKAAWKQLAKLPRDFAFGHFDLDPLGNVTLVALLFSSTDGDSLSVVRFEPDTGWVGPTTVYNRPYAPNAMLNFDVASDKQGNAVVVASDEDLGGVSVVYSYAQRTWLPAQTIPLPADHGPGAVRFIALSRSPNAKYLSLAYLGSLPDKTGTLQLAYYSSKFNSNKLAFGSAEQLPGSFAVSGDNQSTGAGNSGSQVKMVLDNNGNESVIWPSSPNIRPKSARGIYVNRRENGAWLQALKVWPVVIDVISDFSVIAVDSTGNVAVCTTSFDPDDLDFEQFIVIKYLAGSGWSSDVAARWDSGLQTQTAITWLQSGKALGVYYIGSDENGYSALSSSIFDGTTWSAGPPVPPDNVISFEQSLALMPDGSASLLFNPPSDGANYSAIYSSFLRLGNELMQQQTAVPFLNSGRTMK